MFSRYRGQRQLLELIVGGVAVRASAAPTSATPIPRFEATSYDLPDIAAVASRIRCGVASVPRDHRHPDGPTYALDPDDFGTPDVTSAYRQAIARLGRDAPSVAVEGRDRPRWREPPTPDANSLDLGLLPPGVCAAWSTPGLEPELPHDTTVPTLVLAGQFDPNITPGESRHIADWLGTRAGWVLFAGAGHSVRRFSSCARRIVAAFIDAPAAALDSACVARGSAFEPEQP